LGRSSGRTRDYFEEEAALASSAAKAVRLIGLIDDGGKMKKPEGLSGFRFGYLRASEGIVIPRAQFYFSYVPAGRCAYRVPAAAAGTARLLAALYTVFHLRTQTVLFEVVQTIEGSANPTEAPHPMALVHLHVDAQAARALGVARTMHARTTAGIALPRLSLHRALFRFAPHAIATVAAAADRPHTVFGIGGVRRKNSHFTAAATTTAPYVLLHHCASLQPEELSSTAHQTHRVKPLGERCARELFDETFAIRTQLPLAEGALVTNPLHQEPTRSLANSPIAAVLHAHQERTELGARVDYGDILLAVVLGVGVDLRVAERCD
jgi:hypothetical protein